MRIQAFETSSPPSGSNTHKKLGFSRLFDAWGRIAPPTSAEVTEEEGARVDTEAPPLLRVLASWLLR